MQCFMSIVQTQMKVVSLAKNHQPTCTVLHYTHNLLASETISILFQQFGQETYRGAFNDIEIQQGETQAPLSSLEKLLRGMDAELVVHGYTFKRWTHLCSLSIKLTFILHQSPNKENVFHRKPFPYFPSKSPTPHSHYQRDYTTRPSTTPLAYINGTWLTQCLRIPSIVKLTETISPLTCTPDLTSLPGNRRN